MQSESFDGSIQQYHEGSGGARLLLSAEANEWPTHEPRYDDEVFTKRRSEVLTAVGLDSGAFKEATSSRGLCEYGSCNYKYLNYGFMMGPVRMMHDFLTYVTERVHSGAIDQGSAAEYMFNHPDRVTLDYSMSIVASLHEYRETTSPQSLLKVVDSASGKHVFNTVIQANQCFFHGNGGAKSYHGDLSGHLKSITYK